MKSRRLGWTSGVVVIAFALFSLGVRIAHPQDGLKNALGTARSGLVVYQKNPSLVVGEKVLVHLQDAQLNPLLAVVSANKGKTVEVRSATSSYTVQASQIYGKLILVIPFLGSVVGIFG